jgi:hypothetical protein
MGGVRNLDPGLLPWLRDLASRIERLEKGDKGVRVNDTRLGDSVLTPNTYTNQVEMTNLTTGEMVPLTSVRDIVWSWYGPLSGTPPLDGPAACIPDNLVANEIVIVNPQGFGSVCVALVFPNGGTIVTSTVAGQTVRVRPIHIALNRNDIVYVSLYDFVSDLDGDPANVSVTLRFGQPNDLADNTTIDCELLIPM